MSVSTKSIVSRKIGRYYDGDLKNHFTGRSVLIQNYRSKKKLRWDSFAAKLRQILYTDKGTIWAPAIKMVDPMEFDDGQVSERTHILYPVTFDVGFTILNVITADLEHKETVAPVDFIAPVEISAGETVSFEFKMPYFIRGKR